MLRTQEQMSRAQRSLICYSVPSVGLPPISCWKPSLRLSVPKVFQMRLPRQGNRR